MKTRISLLIVGLAFVLTSSHAWADIDKNKLAGTWNGNILVYFHSNANAMAVDMTFDKNGTFTLHILDSDKIDQAKFKIEGDKVLITDGKDKKSYLVDINLTDDKLTGRFEATQESAEQGISIEFSLQRKKK